MRTFALALALLPSLASAAPVTLEQQGRLLDASGQPLQGLQTLVFEVWDAAQDGERVHQESIQVLAQDGFYSVTLGAQGDLDSSEISADGVWLEVKVGTQSLGRSPVGFVPLAAVARDVRGGTVDVSEVRVGGQVVIGADRSVTATEITADSLLIGGETVIPGEVELASRFQHISARATILGTAHNRGRDRRTVTDVTACPSGTTLISWGMEEEIQFWGQTTHWYARCRPSGNGVEASLYTEYGYGGHHLECFGLCVAN